MRRDAKINANEELKIKATEDNKIDQILDQILDQIQVQAQVQTEDQSQVAKWNTKKKLSLGRKLLYVGIIITIFVAIAALIYFVVIKETQKKDATYTADITVGADQELLFGQVTGMNGNEIEFDIVEESTFEMGQNGSDGGERLSGNFSRGDMQTGENPEETISGNMTNSEEEENFPEGENLPDGENFPGGEMPEGMTFPEGENFPEGGMPGRDNSNTTVAEVMTIYQSTGETNSLQIPVGTEVVTKLGNVTTFSRLAVGDVVKLLTEKVDNGQTIVKIWIVG